MPSPITIAGNLTADPELRFTPSGDAVANFTVAVNERKKVGDQFEDDGATFYRVSVWRDQAESVAEQLQMGQRVIVTGGLRTRTWEDKGGVERLSLDLTAEEVGPSLRWAKPKQQRQEPRGRQQSRGGDDPWASNEKAPF